MKTARNLVQIPHEAQFGSKQFFQEPGEFVRDMGVGKAVWGSIMEMETFVVGAWIRG